MGKRLREIGGRLTPWRGRIIERDYGRRRQRIRWPVLVRKRVEERRLERGGKQPHRWESGKGEKHMRALARAARAERTVVKLVPRRQLQITSLPKREERDERASREESVKRGA